MKKRNEITNQLNSKIMSTGGGRYPGRLYGLAKVLNAKTPLRPVLSLGAARMRMLLKRLRIFLTRSMKSIWKQIIKLPDKQLKTML